MAKKPRWQRILELEEAARGVSAPSSSSPPPMPSQSLARDPVAQQMAADLRSIRTKQSIDFYAPAIAILVLIGLAWFILGR